MGADQVAAIRPAIAELEADEQARGGQRPAQYFAIFSVPRHGSPWVEVYLEQETVVNVWFPFEGDPLAYVSARGVTLPPGSRAERVAEACAFTFSRVPSRELARFIDRLFMDLYTCGEDYPVDVELCRFKHQHSLGTLIAAAMAWAVLVVVTGPLLIESADRRRSALAIPGLSLTGSEIAVVGLIALVPASALVLWAWWRRRPGV